MSKVVVISNPQTRVKDCYAVNAVLGLALRSNGEEPVQVFDLQGNIRPAGFSAPTVAPTPTNNGAGNLPANKWFGYVYVYASDRFLFVESTIPAAGSLDPRSNPSPVATLQISGTNQEVEVEVTKTTDSDVTAIWIYRTEAFDDQLTAQTAAEAGQVFFLGSVANDGVAGTETFIDDSAAGGVEQIEMDNFTAPQFQFCVYYDPYFYGIGNLPLSFDASIENTGGEAVITAIDATFHGGRDNQLVRIEGVNSGGIDGKGTFRFKQISETVATLTLNDQSVNVESPEEGFLSVKVFGQANVLYRSKRRNPFAWGFTEQIGAVIAPQEWTFKVSGGQATALAVVPNEPVLKMDFEEPTGCYTLNLRSADTDQFQATLRKLSDTHSVSTHWSQFTARDQNGRPVLWGFDFKNFAMLQCDGASLNPVPTPLPTTFRHLTSDRNKQLMSHGLYDARTEMNCFWVASENAISAADIMIYCHVPSQNWGVSVDYDVLSSGTIFDNRTGRNVTMVGTESGFFGQALAEASYGNWVDQNSGLIAGTVASGTATGLLKADVEDFTPEAIIGNWVLITDADGGQEQIARISSALSNSLTFDRVKSYIGGSCLELNPVPAAGFKFYVGLIECRILKTFNFDSPSADKQFMELWLTQQNSDPDLAGTLLRFYKEQNWMIDEYHQFATLQNSYPAGDLSDAWMTKTRIPSTLGKAFTLEIINRGYKAWKLFDLTLKVEVR